MAGMCIWPQHHTPCVMLAELPSGSLGLTELLVEMPWGLNGCI